MDEKIVIEHELTANPLKTFDYQKQLWQNQSEEWYPMKLKQLQKMLRFGKTVRTPQQKNSGF